VTNLELEVTRWTHRGVVRRFIQNIIIFFIRVCSTYWYIFIMDIQAAISTDSRLCFAREVTLMIFGL
jgi:hypothetical protein